MFYKSLMYLTCKTSYKFMGTFYLINKIYGYKKQGSASGCEHCLDGISVLVWGT